MPVYALFTSVCYNHMTCPPPSSSCKGLWESQYLAKKKKKKEPITMIGLANHDLPSEAGHITTLNKLLNRDYLGDNPYFIIITISYFKPNCKKYLKLIGE